MKYELNCSHRIWQVVHNIYIVRKKTCQTQKFSAVVRLNEFLITKLVHFNQLQE